MTNKYISSDYARFHVPGHKGQFAGEFEKIFPLDITELDFSDNLQCPIGVIKDSQELFAGLFGCKYALYSTNGATAGIFSLVSTIKGNILIERASHSSLYNAIKLFNLETVIFNNRISSNMYLPASYNDIADAIEVNKEISAVFLTSPNYYGKCAEVEKIYILCKEKGIKLFLDAAHGAHFGLDAELPEHPVKHSDACVVSIHKTLPALTQAAAVMTNDLIIAEQTKKALNVFNTSSPSYLILGSIDFALHAVENNREQIRQTILKIKRVKENSKLNYLENNDCLRVVIDFSPQGLTGKIANDLFIKERVVPEFFDDRHVVFVISPFESESNLLLLEKAIKKIESKIGKSKFIKLDLINKKTTKISFFNTCKDKELVLLKKSEGRVCGENVGVYPPALPVIVESEIITKNQISFLLQFDNLFGTSEGRISVYKD